MNDAALALLALGGFGLLLAVGYRIFCVILGTDDEHRQARSRNPRHDLPDPWWRAIEPVDPDEWSRPRQRQPLP